jgi:hypothetical protein
MTILWLSKHATDSICVDSTHGTTSHGFQLTTLLAIDELGDGCPTVAYLLSNTVDSTALARLFLSVKEKVRLISIKIQLKFLRQTTPQHELMSGPA